jgi:hypothetical protein
VFEIVTLRQGCRAVRDSDSGEIMHPSVGPWAEANRLYVEQSDLARRLSEPSDTPLIVYDIGLGGGANAIAALTCARLLGPSRRRPLSVISFDRTLEALSVAARDEDGFPFLGPWHATVERLLELGEWSEDGLRWLYLQGDFLERLAHAPAPADLVFFDPFSPKTNPACWTVEALRRVRAAMSSAAPSLLFTYSAATPTRAALLVAGFFVGAGASVATKGETTVAATAKEVLARPLGGRWLARWDRSPNQAPHGAPLTPEIAAAIRGHVQFRTML